MLLFLKFKTINSSQHGYKNKSKSKESIYISAIPLVIMNGFFVILTNVYIWFFFIWYNASFLSNHFKFKFYFNTYFRVVFLLIVNFQGFHYYSYIHDSCRLIMTIIALIMSTVLLLMILPGFIDTIYFNYLILTFLYYAFWNSLISFINHDTDIENDQFFFKNFIITLLILSNHFFKSYFQRIRFNKVAIQNIFIRNKPFNGDYLFYFILYLIEENQVLYKNYNLTNIVNKRNFFSKLSTQFKTKNTSTKE